MAGTVGPGKALKRSEWWIQWWCSSPAQPLRSMVEYGKERGGIFHPGEQGHPKKSVQGMVTSNLMLQLPHLVSLPKFPIRSRPPATTRCMTTIPNPLRSCLLSRCALRSALDFDNSIVRVNVTFSASFVRYLAILPRHELSARPPSPFTPSTDRTNLETTTPAFFEKFGFLSSAVCQPGVAQLQHSFAPTFWVVAGQIDCDFGTID